MKKLRFMRLIATCFCSLLLVTTLITGVNVNAEAKSTKPAFSIQFIDVGQGDAALVQCDGKYMLIDGGKKSETEKIYEVLKKENVPKLDLVVATHAHEDNVGGLVGAYQYTTADRTFCPVLSFNTDAFKNFAASAKSRGGGITIPKVGSKYQLGSADIEILGVNSAKEENDTSIVLRINYGKTSFLFTGDATEKTEQVLLKTGQNLSSNVLKVACHGSSDSTGKEFLKKVAPKYAVMSVGENMDGHPTKEVLNRLKEQKVRLFRTDWQGDIFCTSDGTNISFTVSKNADADVFDPVQPTNRKANTTEKSTSNSIDKKTKPKENVTVVAENSQGSMVWITQTGSKYHSTSSCSNMKNPSQISLEQALSKGYTACKKCH